MLGNNDSNDSSNRTVNGDVVMQQGSKELWPLMAANYYKIRSKANEWIRMRAGHRAAAGRANRSKHKPYEIYSVPSNCEPTMVAQVAIKSCNSALLDIEATSRYAAGNLSMA